MIRSAALLTRRIAGSPDRLVRGLAVLAVLVAAAAAMLAAGTAPTQARPAGPACAVTGSAVTVMSGAMASTPEARRTIFDRTDIGAADIEVPGDLGLPRMPIEAARPRHARAASYGDTVEPALAPAPDGSLHRPPRLV